jgi:hypothetical protein
MHMHRRRSSRLPSRSPGAGFLDRDGHLMRPSLVERKRQRKGLSLAERLVQASSMMCIPPGLSVTVCPAGMSIAASGRILMTPPSIDIVCSSAFLATGDETAVKRSAVGGRRDDCRVGSAVFHMAGSGAGPGTLDLELPCLPHGAIGDQKAGYEKGALILAGVK